MQGHVAPAAEHSGYPPSQELAVDLPDGTQLARCLRCDAWVHTEVPTTSESPPALPRPLRGRALDELVVIRAIAVERSIHVVLFLLAAAVLTVVELGLPSLQQLAQQFMTTLDQTRSGHQAVARALQDVTRIDGGHLWVLIAMCLAYAALESVEAVFLWRGKRWAEYLTVLATSLLIPLEINELAQKVTVFRVGALVVNLAIVAYLVYTKRLFGVRGGQKRLKAELAADADWDVLHNRAPLDHRPVADLDETPR